MTSQLQYSRRKKVNLSREVEQAGVILCRCSSLWASTSRMPGMRQRKSSAEVQALWP